MFKYILPLMLAVLPTKVYAVSEDSCSALAKVGESMLELRQMNVPKREVIEQITDKNYPEDLTIAFISLVDLAYSYQTDAGDNYISTHLFDARALAQIKARQKFRQVVYNKCMDV